MIKKSIDEEKNRINEEEKVLDKYKIVMATSLIAESLSHEILKIAQKTKTCATNIRKELLKKEYNSIIVNANVDMIISSMQYLYRNASILDSNSYIKRNVFEKVSIKQLLADIVETFPLFDQTFDKSYNIAINGEDFEIELIKNNFVISIENLLINSKYWLDKNGIENPAINFILKDNKVIVYDNGYGVSKDIENDLFDAFVTCKPDSEGRGLGLYLTRQLINEIDASIVLSDERNEYGNRFKFIITF